MKISITTKRARKLREIRKIVEGPMHSNYLIEERVTRQMRRDIATTKKMPESLAIC
jgi:hypothetical protein